MGAQDRLPALVIRLLGPPAIEVGGRPLEVDTRKAVALLAYLAVTGQEHARDTLATIFWPESDQSRARAALRRTLSSLNRALANAWLQADRSTVSLKSSEARSLDTAQFRAALAKADAHGHEAGEPCKRCLRWLDEAAQLYRDDFMAGFTLRDSPAFDEWQFFESQALRRDYARCLDQLIRLYAHAGRLPAALEAAGKLLAQDPLHEAAHRHLMELHARSGNRAAALQQYRACVRILQKELGVPPLEETTALYEAIQEERLHAEALAPGLFTGVGQAAEGNGASAPRHELPLVGRREELEEILEVYQSIGADGRFLVIEGEAGIGKTRLADEIGSILSGRGARVAATRCYEGEMDLAYGALTTALQATMKPEDSWWRDLPPDTLAEAGRLLPGLSAQAAADAALPALDSPGAQTRFFEAIRRIFLATSQPGLPGVFLVDNLHWADEATEGLIGYLVRRLEGHPFLILVTWRTEDVPDNHRFRRLLGQAGSAGSRLVLTRLSLSEVDELLAAIRQRGGEAPAGLAGRLHRISSGLPFFLTEYLAALEANPQQGDEADWEIPEGVRELFEARLSGVGEAELQVLSAAAIIGRSFEFEVLQEASGRAEEEIVRGLEALQAAGLIYELSEPSGREGPFYDFRHEQLRTLMLQKTGQARQRLLHRRTANAILASSGGLRPTPFASRIAHHFAQAGEDEKAAEHYRLAGDRARSLFANAEALSHFQRALSLGHPDVAALHEAIGDLQTLLGEYGHALASYETAAANLDPSETTLIERKLGNVYHRRGEWEQAIRHYEAAHELLDADASESELSRVYADWSLSSHRAGQAKRARSLAKKALDVAERSQDERGLAQIHNILSILARSRGEHDQAEAHLQASLEAAEVLGDPFLRAAALNNLALLQGDAGRYEEAIALAQEALKLCQEHGDRHREAALHNNIADLLHASGKTEEAMPHLKRAAAVFAEIGVEEGPFQPEIWKLTEW